MFRRFSPLCVVLLLGLYVVRTAAACSPSGHVFVAMAAIEKLKKSDDPAARRLAQVLEKYRWVVCHGAEGPDWVQNARGYQNSHYKVLFNVSYESPQSFDLKVAQPVFTALLKDSYRTRYGLTTEDLVRLKPKLYIEPVAEKREVALAFSAGYITHLLSDYFCHRPALTWWEKDSIMQEATKRARPKQSYGPIQSVYAHFLWRSHAKEYGIGDDLRERFLKKVDDYKQDNGVLPFCSLACSRTCYAGWGIDAEKSVAPEKYEACARPIVGPGHLRHCIEGDGKEAEAIFAETGRSFEENLRIGTELTPWREVYDDVIDMIARSWAEAAPQIGIEQVDKSDVIADELARPLPREIAIAGKPGVVDNLQGRFASALTGAVTRDGKRETFTTTSDTTVAMFKVGWAEVGKNRRFGFLAHPPWRTGPGEVYADFLLKLPKPDGRIVFQSTITMHANLTDSDGATFKVTVLDGKGEEKTLAERHVTEKGWTDLEADLSEFAGKTITLRLAVAPGPKDNTTRDNAAWGDPVVSILPK